MNTAGGAGPAGLPELADVLAAAVVVAVPLAVPFRGMQRRAAVLLHGPAGWGEFAPFEEYGEDEASRWLDAAVEAAFLGWPAPVRHHVGVNAIIPAVPPAQAEQMTVAAIAAGARTVKIKVAARGETPADDADRVAAVRGAAGPATALRIDANGAWSPDEATAIIPRLDRVAAGLQYVEQPCADLDGLAQVRRAVTVPVAADESIRRADDPVRAVQAAAVDVVVVKVPPLGGVRAALRVVAAAGVPAVVSGALDTSVGLAAGVALAAALPSAPFDAGLGTGALLADDVVAEPLRPSSGQLAAPARVSPDPEALARATARVDEAERRWWLDRVAAAWQAGTARRLAAVLAHS